jgi:hypothetical protein
MSEAQPPTRRAGSEAIPGLPTERFKARTVLILIGAALLVGLMVVYGIPEIRKRLQMREVSRLVAEATAQFANNDAAGATKVLAEAYRIDPLNPPTLRLMAKSLEQMPGGGTAAAYFWRQLIEARQATTEDVAAYAAILLRTGYREEAQRIFDALPVAQKNTRPVLELKAAFLTADGQANLAEQVLREAYLRDSANPESQFKLAALDINSPFLEVQENAAASLLRIARSGGPLGINAMRVLTSQARLSGAQASDLRKLLEQFPGTSDERRLAIVSGLLRALPSERESIIAAEAARQQGRPFEKTAAFIKWLAVNNEHERLLSLLPDGQAVRDADLFVSYVAAMEHTGRWKELREVIRKSPSLPVPPSIKAHILARCAHALKEPSEIVRGQLEDGLKRAMVARDYPTMMSIGNSADEFGQPDVAIEAFTLLAAQPQFKMPMLERMLQIRLRQRDLSAMIDIMERCLKEQPTNPGYIEFWCYLKLLEGAEMEKAADIIRRHIEANPVRRPTASLIQAFADYRFGDLESAERDADAVAPGKLSAGQRAVLAGILQACGREADALKVAEKVPESIVLTEESRLLKTAF